MRYLLFGTVFSLLILSGGCLTYKGSSTMIDKITSVTDIKALFPKTAQEIKDQAQTVMQKAQAMLNLMLEIPNDARTFENTVRQFDHIGGYVSQFGSVLQALENVSPQEDIRTAAHETALELNTFAIDTLAQNKAVYNAFKAYMQNAFEKEKNKLTQEELYYVTELMADFKRTGLELPEEKREELKKLLKELSHLESDFERNISSDTKTISLTKEALAGVPEEFINSLEKDANHYILRPDYPTQAVIMEHCTVEATRKAFQKMFSTRGYPANEPVLQQVINLRDRKAKLLGYPSYAALDTDDSMAKDVDRIEAFLDDLVNRSGKKLFQEIDTFKKNLPKGISLTKDGKFKAWDLAFIKNEYKNKKFDIDESKIAEYFPMQQTIDSLLKIYEDFFDITFKQHDSAGFWHPDVRLIEVQTKAGITLGYLLLDLHPRPFKFTHACFMEIVPTITTRDGEYYPAVGVVIANFPKATQEKPSLLKRSDVTTFFHEFGHALHGVFGSTEMISCSGTRVKRDFVEMPSQMLEEWMDDAKILKQVARHYKTGESLDDETIERLIAIKNYDIGGFLRRQLCFGKLALEYYAPGEDKDIIGIKKAIFTKLRPDLEYQEDDHFECAFGHLMGYGAKYYGYLWSKVYALDLFDTIKRGGLRNPVMGNLLRAQVLGKGGSKDPMDLLRDFLGRDPQTKAFFDDLGL